MAVLGKVLKGRRAGQAGLACNSPNLARQDMPTMTLSSPDFENGAVIPLVHAAKRVGGNELSPALTWTGAPECAAQFLLVMEDPDAPTPKPFVHCVALIDPSVTSIPQGGLNPSTAPSGVLVLRPSMGGPGYLGPAPIKGHGPHRYVFQIFALAEPVITGATGAGLDTAKPRDVIAAASKPLARGRLDGFYERA
jgi:Raf kinase inhibitor-like YbhB/YbcL family protein